MLFFNFNKCFLVLCILCLYIYLFIFSAISKNAYNIQDIYRIRALPIKTRAADLVTAKAITIKKAKLEALRQIVLRVSGQENFAMPLINELDDMISTIQITEEIFGRDHYQALLNITFKPEYVRRYMRSLGINFVEAKARPVLIIPLIRLQGIDYLWTPNNFWFAQWQTWLSTDVNQYHSVPLKLPRIADDRLVIDDFIPPFPNIDWLTEAYNVSSVYLVRVIMSGHTNFSSAQALINLQSNKKIKDQSLKFLTVELIDLTSAINLDQKLWMRKKQFESHLLNLQSIQNWIRTELNKYWLDKLLKELGQDNQITSLSVSLDKLNINDWITLKKLLTEMHNVKHFQITQITPTSIDMIINIYGSLIAFNRRLQTANWSVQLIPHSDNVAARVKLVPIDYNT